VSPPEQEAFSLFRCGVGINGCYEKQAKGMEMSYKRERNEQYNDIPVEIVDNMLLITFRAEVSFLLVVKYSL
jgi:hypothetical protein